MEMLQLFFGRFHPLLVHLPIGILFLAFVFDLLSLSKRYRRLSLAVLPALFLGAWAALGSVITGYMLAQEGGYTAATLQTHQYAGIATTVFTFILFFLRKNKAVLNFERRKRLPARLLLFLPLMGLLTLTGHLGGALTHGEDFLSEFSSPSVTTEPAAKLKLIKNSSDAVAYRDVIEPILESRCYSCHSSAKQKGELRLDAIDQILKGGKHGSVITNGLADSSSLYSRLLLPLEDEDHMPPKEKPQLSSAEIDLIRLWINDGASFDKKVKELREVTKAEQYIRLIVESGEHRSWIPDKDVDPASEKALQELQRQGALILPLASENNYVSANFINARAREKQKLERLLPIKEQLVSLRLSYNSFSAADLKYLDQFNNLIWLYLDHSTATDSCLQTISSLPNLKYLNLVDTRVSDKGIAHLCSMKSLEEVYLYRSDVTSSGIRLLKKHFPKIKIDSGNYTLTFMEQDTIVHRSRSKR